MRVTPGAEHFRNELLGQGRASCALPVKAYEYLMLLVKMKKPFERLR
jgi:hypothetical protein